MYFLQEKELLKENPTYFAHEVKDLYRLLFKITYLQITYFCNSGDNIIKFNELVKIFNLHTLVNLNDLQIARAIADQKPSLK